VKHSSSGSHLARLWLLEPHRVEVKHGMFGMPVSYEYTTLNSEKIIFPVDQTTGLSDVLHLRNFNPLHASRGLSPMSAAAYSIDTHNAALRWNKALLDNSARPSGALVMKSKDGMATDSLNDEQYARLQARIDDDMRGSANSKKPLLLEGGLEWQEMGLTPAEMDFNTGIWTAATHICAAFQVPPQMIGIPGTSTFANFEQATLTFWEDVVVPLLESILDGLNHWLIPMYGENGLYLEADKDTISALEPRRQIKYDRAEKATFITVNEKREMAGYDQLGPEGDAVLVNSLSVPLDLIAADVHLDQSVVAADTGTPPPKQPAPQPAIDTNAP
jgi:HK97 family phage portal protein